MKLNKKQKKTLEKEMLKKIKLENFFSNTYGVFKICKTPKRKPDFKSQESKYYYLQNGNIIRQSNHWSNYIFNDHYEGGCKNIGTCFWEIYIPKDVKKISKENYNFLSKNYFSTPICGKIEIKNLKRIEKQFLEKKFLLKLRLNS